MGVKDWRPGGESSYSIPIPPGPWRRRGEIQYKVIANLGDRHPIDYGGFIVYVLRSKGQDYLEAEFWHEPETERSKYVVYSFGIADNVLEDLDWVDNWEEVAETSGAELGDLRKMAFSEDPLERANVYRMVAEYHGWDNLDSYPPAITRRELERRWPQYA